MERSQNGHKRQLVTTRRSLGDPTGNKRTETEYAERVRCGRLINEGAPIFLAAGQIFKNLSPLSYLVDAISVIANDAAYIKYTDVMELTTTGTEYHAPYELNVNLTTEDGSFVRTIETICCRSGTEYVNTYSERVFSVDDVGVVVRSGSVPFDQR